MGTDSPEKAAPGCPTRVTITAWRMRPEADADPGGRLPQLGEFSNM